MPRTLEIAIQTALAKRLTGIMQRHQVGAIEADIAGSLPDTLALLREPRLELLDRHPIELKDPAGQVAVKLSLTIPLQNDVQMDDVAIRAQAHLDGVHLSALVAGRDLDQGVFDLSANPDGMKINGRALLASIPSKLDAAMDFRAGPATQVVESVTVSAQPDARQLAAAGLDATSVMMSGPAQMQAVLSERRGGQGDVAVTADLTAAELFVSQLEWRKPRAAQARASARVLLDHDRLTGIDAVKLDGGDLAVRGSAQFSGGTLSEFHLDRLVLGRTIAQGTLDLPAEGPIAVNLTGATLDLAPRLERRTPANSTTRPSATAGSQPSSGPPWILDAKFDRVLMAQGRAANGVVAHARGDRGVIQTLRIEGRIGARAPFVAQIVADRGGRRLTGSTDDAGELLRGLDYVRSMQGGSCRCRRSTTMRSRTGRWSGPPTSSSSAFAMRRPSASCCRR